MALRTVRRSNVVKFELEHIISVARNVRCIRDGTTAPPITLHVMLVLNALSAWSAVDG